MYIFRKTTATTATTATQLMGIYKCIHVLLTLLYNHTYNIKLYVISKNYYIFSFLNFIILNLFRNFVVQNKRSKKQQLRTRKFAAPRGNKISP